MCAAFCRVYQHINHAVAQDVQLAQNVPYHRLTFQTFQTAYAADHMTSNVKSLVHTVTSC